MKYMVMKEELTLDVNTQMQYIDDILYKCTLQTYIVVLTNVFPINLIKKKIIIARPLYMKL